MSFEDYDPPSTLVVPENKIKRSKFPFIDVHNHQRKMPTQDLSKTTADMDQLNMAVMVNLSGRGLDHLTKAVENVQKNANGRFIVFTNINFSGVGSKNWQSETEAQLRTDVKNGANGLKIYKSLGLTSTDVNGKRIAVNDSRLDFIWNLCGELEIPVLIHTGEPAAFWLPKDKNNERWLELKMFPNRYRDPKIFPSWQQIMGEQHDVFRKHNKTKFINAHMGWYANNLEALGKLLEDIPNMYVEIAAVIGELGRQPRYAHKWMIKYQDRVMFGKDTWRPDEYYLYFRVLESTDDYFKYYRRRHAFWRMYGLGLPDQVLKKIYYKNALKVIPGINKSMFPAD